MVPLGQGKHSGTMKKFAWHTMQALSGPHKAHLSGQGGLHVSAQRSGLYPGMHAQYSDPRLPGGEVMPAGHARQPVPAASR